MGAKYFILLLILTIFVGCNPDKGNALNEQNSNIVKYLEQEGRQYTTINGAYKSNRTERISPEPLDTAEIFIQEGDSVSINFVAQVFASSPAGVYDTNIFAIAKQVGLDTLSKDFTPLKIKYGTTQLISGLRSGLKGSKKGDSFSLFMPYTVGYGEKENGIIPGSSAINFEIDVLEIKR